MMWKEFEEIAGYKVSYDTYTNIVEPMYMAVPDSMTKQQFVKLLNRKAIEKRSVKAIVKEMKPIAEHMREVCDYYHDYDAAKKLEVLIKELNDNASYGYSFMLENRNTMENYRGCNFPAYVVEYDTVKWQEVARYALALPWYEQ